MYYTVYIEQRLAEWIPKIKESFQWQSWPITFNSSSPGVRGEKFCQRRARIICRRGQELYLVTLILIAAAAAEAGLAGPINRCATTNDRTDPYYIYVYIYIYRTLVPTIYIYIVQTSFLTIVCWFNDRLESFHIMFPRYAFVLEFPIWITYYTLLLSSLIKHNKSKAYYFRYIYILYYKRCIEETREKRN